MSKNLPQRNEINEMDTWKLEDIFATDTLFLETLQKAKEAIGPFSAYEGKLLNRSDILLAFLRAQDALSEKINKLYVYSHMRLHQDGQNTTYQDFANQTELLSIQAAEALAFASPELSQLTIEKLDVFLKETPALGLYTRYLQEILRQKAHILDSKMESLLAKVSEVADAPSNIFAMFNNVDLSFPLISNEKGEEVRLTHGTYIHYLESKDRKVREEAFSALYKTYASYKNMLATTFSANIKQYGLFASVRGFESPLHYALSANNIPTSVYNNLLTTVNENLTILHDYMTLRKDLLGVKELHMYDLFTPMVKDFELKISYDEACDMILKALAPLGEEYVSIVKRGFNERWVDKYENQGKRSGAYSWGCHGIPHPYVLMNYVDNLSNLFTLAHEMGHALHSYYSHKEQPFIYGDYCIFVAEVASTVNEALLMQYLLKTVTDPNYKKYLLNYFMEQFKSTLYRQTMFAEFEKDMHSMNQEGKTLTSELLCSHYLHLVRKYHGEAVTVDQLIENEWSRIPHFYTPFYVYQYATGYSAAIALSTRILEEGEPAVKAYLHFLKGGSSKDPIDLLKDAGVDMSTPFPIEQALEKFKELIIQMKM
ncbi:oligoendopeptidase F [Sporanaerobium hydrogeniformans]|uniref:Oligoendopeptidase F n=1 Tax=Sporanaerobium hydrogeniformans TaxID=3072179 RepID=A0AC61DGZ0_9FIRM|nr:oligoendopeptidase F [Sporanaerobium hydrogeniformans]PHV71842.1 oligoendopeptidase F [Sporanaerobium hydrogeniformans]